MLLNRRNGLLAGGGGISAKSYVQDGLIAMWDGIENAGWGVHDPNATVWKDLIGGEGISFAVSPQWDDDALICTAQSHATAQGITSRHVNQMQGEYVFRGDRGMSGNPYYEVALVTDYTTNKCFFIMLNPTTTGNYTYFTCRSRRVYIGTPYNVIGRRVSFSVRYPQDAITVPSDAPGFAAYLNGEPTMAVLTADVSISTSNYLRINGGRSAGQGSMMGRLYSIRLYSRALTADEIAANYAVDKARFGLPDAT